MEPAHKEDQQRDAMGHDQSVVWIIGLIEVAMQGFQKGRNPVVYVGTRLAVLKPEIEFAVLLTRCILFCQKLLLLVVPLSCSRM